MDIALDPAPQAVEPPTDEALVARIRGGQRDLFEVLMRRNNQRLYRTIRSVLRDEAEVEDVMQQAYVLAFTHLAQFTGEAKFSTWLLRIALNESFARLRQRKRHLERLDDHADVETEASSLELPMPTPEDRAANRELTALVEKTVDELPALYREVFVLRLVEGLDTAETAAVLDLQEDAVKQRLHRGRALVQKAVEKRLGTSIAAAFAFQAPRCDRVVAAVLARLPQP
jgi:RNA polymerase sigma-70 factor (ECF subfamily)